MHYIRTSNCEDRFSDSLNHLLESSSFVGLKKMKGFGFPFFVGSFDTVGSTELQDAGKAGLVTIQGKISAVLGTVLICKFSPCSNMVLDACDDSDLPPLCVKVHICSLPSSLIKQRSCSNWPL